MDLDSKHIMFLRELVVVIIIASVVCSLSTRNGERKRRKLNDVRDLVWVNGEYRNVTGTLTVTNGGQFGEWGYPTFCDAGMFAVGYNMKIEPDQYYYNDYTALNAITLLCKDVGGFGYAEEIHSDGEGLWGDWVGPVECGNYGGQTFLKSFSLQVEPYQGNAIDDTSANFVKFMCQDFESYDEAYEMVKAPGEGLFGEYGEWSESCGPHTAICGFQTKVDDNQGMDFVDDTGLNDVVFFCCELYGEWEVIS